jgi:hypothetical protein
MTSADRNSVGDYQRGIDTMTSSYTSPRWCQFQNLAAERHLANRAVFANSRRDRRSYASGPSLVASPLPDPSAAASAT